MKYFFACYYSLIFTFLLNDNNYSLNIGVLSFKDAPIIPASFPNLASFKIISFLSLKSKFVVNIFCLRGSRKISL